MRNWTRSASLAAQYGVSVISDEIHAPLAQIAAFPIMDVDGAADAVIVTSASKSFNLAALKAGHHRGGRYPGAAPTDGLGRGQLHFGVLAHSAALYRDRAWLAEAAAEIEAAGFFFAEQLAEKLLAALRAFGTYLAWLDLAAGAQRSRHQHHQVGRGPDSGGSSGAVVLVREVNLATIARRSSARPSRSAATRCH